MHFVAQFSAPSALLTAVRGGSTTSPTLPVTLLRKGPFQATRIFSSMKLLKMVHRIEAMENAILKQMRRDTSNLTVIDRDS